MSKASQRSNGGPFVDAATGVVRPVDIVSFLAVPIVLLGVFALPTATKESFIFSYTDPTVLTAFTAAYVHFTSGHLLNNLAGYAVVVPVAYLLCALSGHRQRFYTAFVTFLVVFPIVLSYLNLAVPRARVGYGFSGVLLAFVGFLPVALSGYLAAQFDVERPLDLAGGLFFFGLALVAALSVPSPETYLLSGLAFAVALLYTPLVSTNLTGIRRKIVVERSAGYFELAAVALCLFVGLQVTAFPVKLVADFGIINIYVHLLGYALGFITTYSSIQVTTRLTKRESRTGPYS